MVAVLQWILELHHHAAGVPIILVGTGLDMRADPKCTEELRAKGLAPISTVQGVQLQKHIGAVTYVECSARTQEGVKRVFDEAVRAVRRFQDPHLRLLYMRMVRSRHCHAEPPVASRDMRRNSVRVSVNAGCDIVPLRLSTHS